MEHGGNEGKENGMDNHLPNYKRIMRLKSTILNHCFPLIVLVDMEKKDSVIGNLRFDTVTRHTVVNLSDREDNIDNEEISFHQTCNQTYAEQLT